MWYAIRTFNCQELKIGSFLKENGLAYFVPMTYAEKCDRKGRVKRMLVPVVHNLVFVRKDMPQKHIVNLLNQCGIPLVILRKRETSCCYEIPEHEMLEFRALCDPDFDGSQFITSEEAEAKSGKTVRIIHGQFAGMTGKLHRVRNNYFFIKTLVGIGVMIRISRWYCQVVE